MERLLTAPCPDYLRQGLASGSGVPADWIGTAVQEILPVVRQMRLASPRLLADETMMQVLDPGRGQENGAVA